MYRPALVIGLGGTGILTLRHLKDQLMASKDHQHPRVVKLIALDTVAETPNQVKAAAGNESTVLKTKLDDGEYFWIGGNVYQYTQAVDSRPAEYPHVASWFQAKTYLETLPPAAFALDRGAGMLRQFGRLAIFKDVEAPANSRIYSLIKNAIDDLRRPEVAGGINNIDIFLVSSVAGGTGAGMFVDIAYLARQICGSSLGATIRGFLVLPEAFSAIPGGVKPAMRARAFACMRENKRFMVDFQYEHGYPMFYHASGTSEIWRETIKTKLFDTLFHIDGRSAQNPLTNLLPEVGITAAIADVIAAILDKPADGANDVYAEHSANVITQAASLGVTVGDVNTTSFDSGMGSFSLILPMRHITDWLGIRLAISALDKMLAPNTKDADGFIVNLKDDANLEFPGTRGSDVAKKFLGTTDIQSLQTDTKVSNTPFFAELQMTGIKYGGSQTSRDEIVRELSSREARDWEAKLDPNDNTPEVSATRNRVQAVLVSKIKNDVPANQRGETPGSALDRITTGVTSYKNSYFGREDTRNGQRVGGEYRKNLENYTRWQLGRYQVFLQVETENILNGGFNPESSHVEHKGGKLGYLLDWFEGLENVLGNFIAAMNASAQVRLARNEKGNAIVAAQTSFGELQKSPGGIFGGNRRSSYLEAEQRDVDCEKVAVVEDMARNTAIKMLEKTKQLHEDAKNWASKLAFGMDSVYGILVKSEKQVRDVINAEKGVKVREYVWDNTYLQQLYTTYAGEDGATGIEAVLQSLRWQFERQPGPNESHGFRLLSGPERLGLENQDRNKNFILNPAKAIFDPAWEQESVLKYLMRVKFTDGNNLASYIAGRVGVLLQQSSQTQVPSNYLHVAYGFDPAERGYLDIVKQKLQDLGQASGKLNSVVNSSDRFAMRVVHTIDLIPVSEIQSYKDAQADYWSQNVTVEGGTGVNQFGRETLHNFPAEVNAARFETRIQSKLSMNPRALHNDIVIQLENIDEFGLFVRCWAYYLIKLERGKNASGASMNFWQLNLPEVETGTVAGPIPALQIYLTRPVPGDSDLVEAMKTWNYMRNDVRPNLNIGIPYQRARQAVETVRQARVQASITSGEQIEDTARREQIKTIPQSERESFQRLWMERKFLLSRQVELKEQIMAENAGTLIQDSSIAMFMVLDDEISSLNVSMDQILRTKYS